MPKSKNHKKKMSHSLWRSIQNRISFSQRKLRKEEERKERESQERK